MARPSGRPPVFVNDSVGESAVGLDADDLAVGQPGPDGAVAVDDDVLWSSDPASATVCGSETRDPAQAAAVTDGGCQRTGSIFGFAFGTVTRARLPPDCYIRRLASLKTPCRMS